MLATDYVIKNCFSNNPDISEDYSKDANGKIHFKFIYDDIENEMVMIPDNDYLIVGVEGLQTNHTDTKTVLTDIMDLNRTHLCVTSFLNPDNTVNMYCQIAVFMVDICVIDSSNIGDALKSCLDLVHQTRTDFEQKYPQPRKKNRKKGSSSISKFIIILLLCALASFILWKSCSNNTKDEPQPKQTITTKMVDPNEQEDYPFTAQRLITESELSSYNKEELSIMRNEIYARHGYIFKRADLKEYFSQKTWYNPRYSSVDKFLSKIETTNVQTILKVEKKRK